MNARQRTVNVTAETDTIVMRIDMEVEVVHRTEIVVPTEEVLVLLESLGSIRHHQELPLLLLTPLQQQVPPQKVDLYFTNRQPPQQQEFLLVWAIVQSSLLRSLQITVKIHFLHHHHQGLSQLLHHLHPLHHQPLLPLSQVHQFLLHHHHPLV